MQGHCGGRDDEDKNDRDDDEDEEVLTIKRYYLPVPASLVRRRQEAGSLTVAGAA
jgi:hypothetical protein